MKLKYRMVIKSSVDHSTLDIFESNDERDLLQRARERLLTYNGAAYLHVVEGVFPKVARSGYRAGKPRKARDADMAIMMPKVARVQWAKYHAARERWRNGLRTNQPRIRDFTS